jgi:hypothetical protein
VGATRKKKRKEEIKLTDSYLNLSGSFIEFDEKKHTLYVP